MFLNLSKFKLSLIEQEVNIHADKDFKSFDPPIIYEDPYFYDVEQADHSLLTR